MSGHAIIWRVTMMQTFARHNPGPSGVSHFFDVLGAKIKESFGHLGDLIKQTIEGKIDSVPGWFSAGLDDAEPGMPDDGDDTDWAVNTDPDTAPDFSSQALVEPLDVWSSQFMPEDMPDHALMFG